MTPTISMYIRLLIGILCYIQFFSIEAFPEERFLNLTIDEAVRLAIQQNARLDIGRRSVVHKMEQVEIEKSKFLPSLTIRGMYSELNGPQHITVPAGGLGGSIPPADANVRIGDSSLYNVRLTLEQPVFTGMATTYRYKIAEKEAELSRFDYERQLLDIVYETKKRYFELLRVQRIKEMTFFAIKVLEDHLRVAQELFDAGMITKNDLLKSQVAVAEGKYDDLRADNLLSSTKLSFKKFLSIEEDIDLHIHDLLDQDPVEIDIEASIQQALRNRPEITIDKLSAESAGLEASFHKSEYFPDLRIAGTAGYQEGIIGLDRNYWDIGILLTWKLWEGRITAHKVAQSYLKEKDSRRRLAEQSRDIRLEVRRSGLNVHESQRRIQTMQETVSQAEENLRISEERYREQVTTSTEVLDALALLVKIRIQYYTSVYDFHISKAEFERSISSAVFQQHDADQ